MEYIGPDLSDLSDCFAHVPNRSSVTQRWHLGKSHVEWLYFISAVTADLPDGPVKIGVSRHPQARLEEMERHSPVRLEILALSKGGYAAERRYHERFAADRLHGEWFKRSAPLMNLIRWSKSRTKARANLGTVR